MRASGWAPAWFLWVLAGAVFVLDWLTKRWVIDALALTHTRPVLGDFFRLSYVRNRGVAFGLFAERSFPLFWVSVAALVALLWLALRPGARRWARAAPLGLILGGAFGNLLDRLRWGSVIDFVDIGIGDLRWWVFNLADAAITIGVCLWAAQLLFARPRAPGEAFAEGASARGGEAGAHPAESAPADDARGA